MAKGKSGKKYSQPAVDTRSYTDTTDTYAESLPGQLLSPAPLLSEYVSLLSDGNSGGVSESLLETREKRMSERDFLKWGRRRPLACAAGIGDAEFLDVFDVLLGGQHPIIWAGYAPGASHSQESRGSDGLIGYPEYCLADALLTAAETGRLAQFAKHYSNQLFESLRPAKGVGPSCTDVRLLCAAVGVDDRVPADVFRVHCGQVDSGQWVEQAEFRKLFLETIGRWGAQQAEGTATLVAAAPSTSATDTSTVNRGSTTPSSVDASNGRQQRSRASCCCGRRPPAVAARIRYA